MNQMYSPGIHMTEQVINIITNLVKSLPSCVINNNDLIDYISALFSEDSTVIAILADNHDDSDDGLHEKMTAENVLLAVINIALR